MTALASCRDCDWEQPAATYGAASNALWTHYLDTHTNLPAPAEVKQLPAVDWHAQALAAIRTLSATGKPLVISQVIDLGVPDAPNPRTDWAKVQREAESFGWIEKTGALGHSVRPTTKGSPVTEWRGTFAVRRGVA